jgi:hypothetical protein
MVSVDIVLSARGQENQTKLSVARDSHYVRLLTLNLTLLQTFLYQFIVPIKVVTVNWNTEGRDDYIAFLQVTSDIVFVLPCGSASFLLYYLENSSGIFFSLFQSNSSCSK